MMNAIEGEERDERALALARLANACRQIGAMMEAGVDILSITRVLRSQNADDEDILRLCEHIDFDLKQGRALSAALADEPTLFSPFMVTLVRQGEERGTLPQAFARVAQAIESERQELLQAPAASVKAPAAPEIHREERTPTPQAPREIAHGLQSPVSRLDLAYIERAGARWLRGAGRIGAALLAASAASEALSLLGIVSPRWQRPLWRALSAGVLALAARQARQPQAPVAPQVLEPEFRPPPQIEVVELAEEAAPQMEEAKSPPVAERVEQAPAPNAVYSGAPREDEEEAPRQVRRPSNEEEFD